MQLTLSKETIIKSLDIVIGATKVNNIKPILNCVMLCVEKDTLTMIATDYEVEITAFCYNIKAEGDFKQVLSAAKLLNICRSLENNTEVNIVFTANTAKIEAGNSTFSLMTQNVDDFVTLGMKSKNQEEVATLSGEELIAGLRAVRYASSQQSHRAALNGILIESEASQINFIATDGHRMAVKKLTTKEKTDIKRILPRKSVELLLQQIKEDDEVKISLIDKFVQVKTARFEFISNIIEENYPDYLSVIPRNNEKKVLVERLKILSAIRRSVVLSDKKATIVMGLSENKMEINSSNRDNEKLCEWIEVNYNDEALEIGFDASFLLDMLATLDDDMIEISFSDTKSGVLMKPVAEKETFIYVVMPIRTSQQSK